ncbi:Alpha/beta hydrolase fold-1, partial [Cynara cardunculus var. scolymus]
QLIHSTIDDALFFLYPLPLPLPLPSQPFPQFSTLFLLSTTIMYHCLISTFQPPLNCTLHITHDSGLSTLRQKPFPKDSTSLILSTRTTRLPDFKIMAKKKAIEGVSDQMNAIASQNLDHAPARRRVRLAFTQVQEQLDHVLFKMPPTGIRTEEWFEMNSKGQEIFCKSWLPRPGVRIKAAVCFVHGYGDTCTFFFEGIAKRIAAAGYGVYAIDHPGFGLSEGLHGYVPSFNDIVDNVIEQYTKIKGRPEVRGMPRFLLGQSMGGAVALKVHLKEQREWDGVVLVAPIGNEAPGTTAKSSNLFVKSHAKSKADYNVISYSDQTRLKTAVSSPLLILHGAADKVTDPNISKFLYEKAASKDKTLKLYDGSYHCILEGESDERIFEVLDDITAWLDSHSALR